MSSSSLVIDYVELKEDILMLGSMCPNFISRMNEVLETAETREMISQYLPLFDYLSYYTEKNISTPSDVALVYASLETMVSLQSHKGEFKWAIIYLKNLLYLLSSLQMSDSG